ncbi:polysaccharide biosynthesis/export family protein [Swingsia samuiensis]|nr:polysaccharide biosynthesis/export family protein [Swingsia samuiensis]
MKLKQLPLSVALLSGLVFLPLTSCSLPNAGPLAEPVEKTRNVHIVNVTPEIANAMNVAENQKKEKDLTEALYFLNNSSPYRTTSIHPGDTLNISLWSFQGADESSLATSPSQAPQKTALGSFQVNTAGNITLPYVGSIRVAGKTPDQARRSIVSSYVRRNIVNDPDITVDVASTQTGITVTGSIGQPKILSWSPGGMSLSQAITLALGNGTSSLSENSNLDKNTNAIRVSVVRHEQEAQLPISVALEKDIALQPADKVIIKKESPVQVVVMGGGINHNGLYGFGESPSLSGTLAQAQGLNPNSANSTRIFVFRREPNSQMSLYVFSWKDGNGLIAAQDFPIKNKDVVYVAESPMVPIARVINTIFQMALPAAILR